MAKKTKKRIIITGAQGTGKTTLMNALAIDGTKTLSLAREAAENDGYDPAVGSDAQHQKTLYTALHKAVSKKSSYISDRGLTCVAAYTFDGVLDGRIEKDVADKQYIKTQEFHEANPDIIVVYTPIEFDIEDDGMRSTDKEHQARIDFLIKNILDTAGIDYITVTGTVAERVEQVNAVLANL